MVATSIFRYAFVGFILFCLQATVCAAAEPQEEPWSPAWIKSQTKKAAELSRNLTQKASGLPGKESILLVDRAGRYSELEFLYRRNLTVSERHDSLTKEQERWTPSDLAGPEAQQQTFNLSQLDQKLDDQTALVNQIEGLSLAVDLSKTAHEEASKRLKQAQSDLRSLVDSLGSSAPTPEQIWKQSGLELEQDIASARKHLEMSSSANQTLELSLRQAQLDSLSTQVNHIRAHLSFDSEDLEGQLKRLASARSALKIRQVSLKKEQTKIEQAWLQSKDELGKWQQEDYVKRAKLLVSTREAWRDTYQKVLEQTEIQLTWVNLEEQLWRHRYSMLESNPSRKNLDLWASTIEKSLNTLDRQIQLQQTEQTRLQSEQLAVPDTTGLSLLETKAINNRRQAIRKLIERGLEFQSRLQALKALHLRTQKEVEAFRKGLKLTEKIGAVSSKAWEIWDIELWVIDEKPVTLKKAIYALVLLILGLLGARQVTVIFRRKVLPSLDLDESSAATAEKILHYFLIFLLVLMTLNLVNIPLTAFTFLGGAVAIAFGFGAQNLLNNFISGFIIMAERPIKIGDMIEMEDSFGIVEEIGARCTRIRTPTNVHLLVPNSAFLEKNITNWTLSNMQIRSNVTVGVAYGSPLELVRELLFEAANGHDRISFEPRPEVFFRDFGDNSLNFAVFFSLTLQNLTDRYRIQSDVRFSIAEIFEKNSISIAFPQRDLHLVDSAELKVRLVKPTE